MSRTVREILNKVGCEFCPDIDQALKEIGELLDKKGKGYLRCMKDNKNQDAFMTYQDGWMSKGKLIDYIIREVREVLGV